MKVGDLVRCKFQPRSGGYDLATNRLLPMEHIIENQLGIIVKEDDRYRDTPRFRVLFTHFGYEHTLVQTVLESL